MTTDHPADVSTPQGPDQTPEQARLGILPPASGSGTFEDVLDWMNNAPHFDGTDAEFDEFLTAIAENRAMRRKLARNRRS